MLKSIINGWNDVADGQDTADRNDTMSGEAEDRATMEKKKKSEKLIEMILSGDAEDGVDGARNGGCDLRIKNTEKNERHFVEK